MKHYSKEHRRSVTTKMMPLHNERVSELTDETGISLQTLYNWRQQAREEGEVVPGDGKNSERWSSSDKFALVLETAAMNEAELSEYCRSKGLYLEKIADWKATCKQANASSREARSVDRTESKQDRRRIKKLEAELRRKDRALAETAALLALQKKARALWGGARTINFI